MYLQNAITIGDILTIVALCIAIIGIFLTRYQIKQGYELQKASFFKDLYQMMFGDSHIREAFYLVDYEKFVFRDNFAGSPEEQSIDHLLNYVDLLCGLYVGKMLTKQEMNCLEYEFRIIYSNAQIQAYLTFLREVYKQEKASTMPYANFVAYCEKELLFLKKVPIDHRTGGEPD